MAKAIIQQQVDELLKKISEHDKDLADLLKKFTEYLPLTGGTLTGQLSVPSTFHVLPEGVEGGQIQLDKGTGSSESAVIDLLGDYIRFFGSTTAIDLARVNLKTGDFEGKFSGGLTQVFVEKRGAGTGVQVPAGGTWTVFAISDHGGSDNRVNETATVAGGTFIAWSYGPFGFLAVGIRIA